MTKQGDRRRAAMMATSVQLSRMLRVFVDPLPYSEAEKQIVIAEACAWLLAFDIAADVEADQPKIVTRYLKPWLDLVRIRATQNVKALLDRHKKEKCA